eukprot:CAMPEP_0115173458 /NCGR_PEP_ID=MMETSP0270-20121206/3336_1 /TAXON_ID=71861 /ORGANISM="Scrippsiella trochoidea, Strain CCMP3099" /LENGTH=96 /DNA_ID=CAMNT_0002586271 /DNA_START=387 /DNA_END=677 /DNA_ORIENTATION=-
MAVATASGGGCVAAMRPWDATIAGTSTDGEAVLPLGRPVPTKIADDWGASLAMPGCTDAPDVYLSISPRRLEPVTYAGTSEATTRADDQLCQHDAT